MNTHAAGVSPADWVFKKATARETAALLAIAWFVPFAVHLVPWAGARPLGAHLLPMFWMTFVAVYFYGVRTGIIVGLFAPAINLLATGLPAWKFIATMSAELVLFALVAAWGVRRFPRLVLIAPLAYVAAKLAVTGAQLAIGSVAGVEAAGAALGRAFVGGLAGLVILGAINAALGWFYPKTGRSEGE